MHELGIAKSLCETLEKEMIKAGGKRVTRVSLVIGALSGVMPDYLRDAFAAYSKGTFAEGAELRMELVKPEAVCQKCGKRYEPSDFLLRCEGCGSLKCKVTRGKEMHLSSLEVEV